MKPDPSSRFGETLQRVAAKRGATRAEQLVRRLSNAVTASLPGLSVKQEGTRITIAGRGLARRRLVDPVLRWLGALLR